MGGCQCIEGGCAWTDCPKHPDGAALRAAEAAAKTHEEAEAAIAAAAADLDTLMTHDARPRPWEALAEALLLGLAVGWDSEADAKRRRAWEAHQRKKPQASEG